MKTVQIEDDLYTYIAAQTLEIGEPATSILRRLLNIPKQGDQEPKQTMNSPAHELAKLLVEPTFTRSTPAVYRMLKIFQEIHIQHPTDFYKILDIRGRDRLYFAKSEKEILASGTSTQPREIEGSGCWVMTNSTTRMKQQLVIDVLSKLNYSKAAIEAAAKVIQ